MAGSVTVLCSGSDSGGAAIQRNPSPKRHPNGRFRRGLFPAPVPGPRRNDSILGCRRDRSPRYGLGRGNHDDCSRAQHRTTNRSGGSVGAGAALGVDPVGGGGGGPARDTVDVGCERLRAARQRTTSTAPTGPAAVAGLSNVVQVEGGREHIIALTATGQVLVWGSNENGQLGLGDSTNRTRPTTLSVPCGAGRREPGRGRPQQQSGPVHRRPGLRVGPELRRTARRRHAAPCDARPCRCQGVTDAVYVASGRDMSYAVRAGRHRRSRGATTPTASSATARAPTGSRRCRSAGLTDVSERGRRARPRSRPARGRHPCGPSAGTSTASSGTARRPIG